MSRRVDFDGPLSESDREYLHSRGLHQAVAKVDEEFGTDNEPHADGVPAGNPEDPGYENWTVRDLQDEIRERNKELATDQHMLLTGKQAELAARLRADDAAAL